MKDYNYMYIISRLAEDFNSNNQRLGLNVEIKGVPHKDKVNLNEIVYKIGAKFSTQFRSITSRFRHVKIESKLLQFLFWIAI